MQCQVRQNTVGRTRFKRTYAIDILLRVNAAESHGTAPLD